MRTIRLTNLLIVLTILCALSLGPAVFAQDDQPIYGQIVIRGIVDCFEEGLMADEEKPVYCETSTLVYLGDHVVFASDKPVPGEGYSSVFSFPYAGSGPVEGSTTYFTADPFLTAVKYEDMTITPDGQYVIATTGFDRVKGDSNEWDGYNTLMTWPLGNPDGVIVSPANTNEGVTSSVSLRDDISQALTTPEFPDGVPYSKVEGMTVLPDNRLLFGIREMGAKYDNFEYAVKILAAPYEMQDGALTLTGDFELIYDFDPATEPLISQTPALSSIEYDPHNDRLYLLTSFETEETDEGLGAYLWTLPLADLEAGNAPSLVLKDENSPLLFAHKGEGVTVLGDNSVMVVHDDDRVLGRDDVTNPETQFSRAPHQAAYTLVSLGAEAPATVPETGGTGFPAYLLVIVLGGLIVVIGFGLERAYRRSSANRQ